MKRPTVALVDHGMGNLASVAKALEWAGAEVCLTDAPEVVRRTGVVVLPGVGAFRDAAARLRDSGLGEAVVARIAAGVPFLGVCLGLQLLFERSLEGGEWPGLGVFAGSIERLDTALKVPQIGWNELRFTPAGEPLARSATAGPRLLRTLVRGLSRRSRRGRGRHRLRRRARRRSGARQRLGGTVPSREEFGGRSAHVGQLRRVNTGGEPVRLYPAIDIKEGQAVRLRQGDFERATVFADDPVEQARRWKEEGAQVLHVVDLDGARLGRLANFALVQRIVAEIGLPVQFGGGIRSQEALDVVAASGVRWAIIGTGAVIDQNLLETAIARLGERLVVSVDCAEGMLATHGWQERSSMSATRFMRLLEQRGVKRVVYTDVSRDGMLEGPNLEELEQIADVADLEVIMSGGVTTLDDLRRLRKFAGAAVVGVIVGRALYEGVFTLAEAVAALA